MPRTERDYVALSCVCVGVGPGGTTSMLARVAVVSWFGSIQFEAIVSPGTHVVTDYRTSTTGITEQHLLSAEALPFNSVQQRVSELIKGKLLIGHSLWNDLSVLGIPHPAVDTRDTALYMPFRNGLKAQQIVGLPTLMWNLMAREIQQAGSHLHPVENARAAMDLYRSYNEPWEAAIQKGNWPCILPPSTFSRCYT
ncbi:hypothetical protein AGABI1DRAFT_96512 [Agaricus bisporus var. burnettii JB137-S8]|uniref:RNA exonuclease 4 n=2 Tax=Agaricus bisporus var. burnettii TaxID=192524 RepID=K5XJI4_AGABU|nr:uncharacterized protein AGABI1DRAFT_96512 [Agaricus bisporus var. burnettii JB137-S8]EKM83527.1 hypothetical protein AGABI1DRAFT_96512 [Agaricus bisporus var. burnettii JB137-S8]KAF7784659.1 hypothetical protein Agabi119p4_824 [Agaricus bisporus var. burnettii]